jgi:phage terminase Nu1 subunit (DNA packaging protein)
MNVTADLTVVPILESLPLEMKRNWPEITGNQDQLVKIAIAHCRNAIADIEIDI